MTTAPQAPLHVQGRTLLADNTTGITANYSGTKHAHTLSVTLSGFGAAT